MINLQEILKGIKPYVLGWVFPVGWTDYSATSTIVGWTSFTAKVLNYRKVGKLVFVEFYISGTSNSINTSFSLPYTKSGAALEVICRVRDNSGALSAGLMQLLGAASTANFYSTVAGGAWTASGTKQISGQFWYEVA